MNSRPIVPSARQPVDRSTYWTMPIVIGLLLLAFALRVWAIDALPPGLTHDEVSQLDTAAQVRAGDWRLLYPGGFAQDGAEPGYYPLLAASQAIWGENSLGRRLPSIFAGMIGLACIYALAARLFGKAGRTDRAWRGDGRVVVDLAQPGDLARDSGSSVVCTGVVCFLVGL